VADRVLLPRFLFGELPKQFQDVLLDAFDVGLNFAQRTRRLILVEVAVELDLVTDFAAARLRSDTRLVAAAPAWPRR
jgi:hypothetical protein